MARFKWTASHLAAGLLLTGAALATPTPQAPNVSAAASASISAIISSVPSTTPEVDFAARFVQELIANATSAEESLLATKKRSLVGAFCKQDQSLVVNLGYAKYQGYTNSTSGLNYWKGSERLLLIVDDSLAYLLPASNMPQPPPGTCDGSPPSSPPWSAACPSARPPPSGPRARRPIPPSLVSPTFREMRTACT